MREHGFEQIEAYSDTPTPGAIYMKRELVSAALKLSPEFADSTQRGRTVS